jgi:thiosulfate reductase cytochrome b subunit
MNIEEIVPTDTCSLNPGSKNQKKARWFSWARPQSYWDVVVAHLPLALVTGIPLLLSSLVPLRLLPMIPCTFLQFTGYPGPFCGFTRAFWAISHGAWSDALANCPLAGLLYVLVVFVFVWNASGLWCGLIIKPGTILAINRGQGRYIIGLISVLFLINWVYRLSMGFL